MVELDIRSFLSFSQIVSSPGQIASLFSPQPRTVLYTTQHVSSYGVFQNQILNYADVSDSWTRTGKWALTSEDEVSWGRTTVINEENGILLGISGCKGITLISGTHQNMMWQC